jgi:sulfonate transport system ATP-binding protein
MTNNLLNGLGLQLEGVQKHFGSRTILRNFDLTIPPGQFVAVVGRSGCGKSTLLRLLSGLDTIFGGCIGTDAGEMLTTAKRQVRLMFQDARLLPWKSVLDNVCLGLPRTWRRHALDALNAVGLEDRARDWPASLSGGQRQRIALARALIHRPRLLLLDEPLGALDALTRIEMQQLIETLWQQNGFTVILVTHDISEAVAIADRVILMEDGGIGLDLQINQERPRVRHNAELAALENLILDRVLTPVSRQNSGQESVPGRSRARADSASGHSTSSKQAA